MPDIQHITEYFEVFGWDIPENFEAKINQANRILNQQFTFVDVLGETEQFQINDALAELVHALELGVDPWAPVAEISQESISVGDVSESKSYLNAVKVDPLYKIRVILDGAIKPNKIRVVR